MWPYHNERATYTFKIQNHSITPVDPAVLHYYIITCQHLFSCTAEIAHIFDLSNFVVVDVTSYSHTKAHIFLLYENENSHKLTVCLSVDHNGKIFLVRMTIYLLKKYMSIIKKIVQFILSFALW